MQNQIFIFICHHISVFGLNRTEATSNLCIWIVVVGTSSNHKCNCNLWVPVVFSAWSHAINFDWCFWNTWTHKCVLELHLEKSNGIYAWEQINGEMLFNNYWSLILKHSSQTRASAVTLYFDEKRVMWERSRNGNQRSDHCQIMCESQSLRVPLHQGKKVHSEALAGEWLKALFCLPGAICRRFVGKAFCHL